MRVYENGYYRNATESEIAAAQQAQAAYEAQERHRPLTTDEIAALLIRQQINTIDVDDQTALRMLSYYPEWQAGQDCPVGHKAQRGGRLCRCLQAHTSQAGWEPENAPALWEYINETYTGDRYDPIPYDGSMELTEGLYYAQSGVVYLCTRGTGQPVYNALSELVGLYVEVS